MRQKLNVNNRYRLHEDVFTVCGEKPIFNAALDFFALLWYYIFMKKSADHPKIGREGCQFGQGFAKNRTFRTRCPRPHSTVQKKSRRRVHMRIRAFQK